MRWIVPTGIAGAVALGASGVLSAQASPDLPPRTAAQLLVDVKQAHVDGLSGTIVSKASLGLPSLPSQASSGGLLGLLTGSHTARVWYAGEEKQRFALLDTLGETDVFHNGRDLWTYDSTKHQATHTVLPAHRDKHPAPPATVPTLTPEQAAEQALQAIDPTTVVSTDSARRVAGRAAYELVLAPRDTTSKVGSVRIAIDGETKVPLGVQVYPRGGKSPALDVSFTRIHFAVPDEDNFTFNPPKSVKVKEESLNQLSHDGSPHHATPPATPATTIGKGWTTIVRLDASELTSGASDEGEQVLRSLPRVSWAGGSGRLFDSKLLTALITDDGRLYAGAVGKNMLISAAEHRR